jgi:hypothetical protein
MAALSRRNDMTLSIKPIMLLLPWGVLAARAAYAQEPPAPPPEAPALATAQTPLYDPAQLPSFTGRVQQFTLTLRGEIDGVILSDGTEVKTAPALSTSMAYSIKPGDTLTIHGLRAAAIPLLQAVSITDRTSGKTIVDADSGPRPGSRPPGPGTGETQQADAQGIIRMSVHGPRGEINGVLLTDGTVLRLPPDAALTLTSLLQPGKTVFAQGDGVSNAIGKVLDVREIGPSRDALSPVVIPAPPGGRGPVRPLREGPPPPPPPAALR